MNYSHISLTNAQCQHLTALTTRGTVAVKTFRRAAGLLALNQGQRYSAVGRAQGVTYRGLD